MSEVNKLHRMVGNGDLLQIEKLEAMNADEYYSTLNTFIRISQENKE